VGVDASIESAVLGLSEVKQNRFNSTSAAGGALTAALEVDAAYGFVPVDNGGRVKWVELDAVIVGEI